MSNTGRSKKLASFNCDASLWAKFIAKCQEKGTTATATLVQFIELYLDDSLDNLDAIEGSKLDKHFDERIKTSVDEYLDKCLPSQIDKYLAANYLAKKPRSSKSTDSAAKKEFWFIEERAKHLGIKLSSNQLNRAELFAADSYKERHGKPPGKRPYRSIQTSIYPTADLDIVDSLIKGVAAQG